MNSKRYRKRKSGAVSMNTIRLRESHSNRGVVARHRRKCYPLFESWNQIYNYKNLMESINLWDEFSGSESDNVKQTGTLLEEIGRKGTEEQSNAAAHFICENVLSYIKNPQDYAKYFSKLQGVDEARDYILDQILLFSECDRVSNNYKLLSEKYNMNKFFIEGCNYWGVDETMFRLCEMMEQYGIEDFGTRFDTTVENALYGLTELIQEYEIPKQFIIEAIIDYHLINDGCYDTPAYFKALREAAQASDFVPEECVEKYVSFLESVLANKERTDIMNEYYSNPGIQAIAQYDEYLNMNKSVLSFYEAGFLDQAKEMVAKIKLAPIKNLGMIKEAINACLVTRRLQDIKEGTHNALSIAFYCLVIAGFATLGAIPTVLGAITSLLLKMHIDKQYLKSAISEWNEHKYSVKRKMRATKDAAQRRKLETYLSEVEKNIEILTDEYEKERDRTAQEMNDQREKYRSFRPDETPMGTSAEVDPTGRYTPAHTNDTSNSMINKADREG